MTATALSIRDLRFAYPGASWSLAVPHFEIAPGEQVLLVGGSGRGKSKTRPQPRSQPHWVLAGVWGMYGAWYPRSRVLAACSRVQAVATHTCNRTAVSRPIRSPSWEGLGSNLKASIVL